jgi:hypothetical protein
VVPVDTWEPISEAQLESEKSLTVSPLSTPLTSIVGVVLKSFVKSLVILDGVFGAVATGVLSSGVEDSGLVLDVLSSSSSG